MKADHRIEFDSKVSLANAGGPGHNRWHPDVAPVLRIMPGDSVALDLWDGLDAQVTPMSRVEDLLEMDHYRNHAMVGPIYIEGAEPGDLLTVEILRIESDQFGFTFVLPKLGALGERFTDPFLVKWRIEDNLARSDDLPGVVITGAPFVGLIGVAPSEQRLAAFTERELELSRRGAGAAALGKELMMQLPDRRSAVPPNGRPATEGLRTLPPRETGGNLDVKNYTEGAQVTLPVDVPGALCSLGDPHFAQGDGESCALAIEMSAKVLVRFNLIKASHVRWRPRNPTFEFEEPAHASRRFISTTGFPVSIDGRNDWLDLNLAARGALEEMLSYLTNVRGYTEYQAYVITSAAVDLRISEIVDAPNAVVSAVLPLDIFE
jgi:formamidase